MTYDELVSTSTPTVVYDGDCPFCKTYVQYMRFKQAVGTVRLIDVRSQPELVQTFKSKGYNLNDGMVFIMNNKVHYGDDAVFTMSLLSTPVGFFNKVNGFIFGKPLLSKALYPILVIARKVVLSLLRKTPL